MFSPGVSSSETYGVQEIELQHPPYPYIIRVSDYTASISIEVGGVQSIVSTNGMLMREVSHFKCNTKATFYGGGRR